MPVFLKGDSIRFCQILFGLISNSVKITPLQGKIRLKIKLQEREEHDLVKITIKNSGEGISVEKVKRGNDTVFNMINNEKKEYEEIVLGLSMIKKIVNSMNGTIEVKSKVGDGDKFTVLLPFPDRN